MGTRADFYIGRGESAEWLGSIAWDGYPDGIAETVLKAKTEGTYRLALSRFFLDDRDDVTLPKDGWPWPWDDSRTTDYAYAFDKGRVYACCFGHKWYLATSKRLNEDSGDQKLAVFPNMKDRANVEFGGKRSGLIVIGLR